MSRFVPLSIPNFEGNETKYVNEALEQGWVSTGGAFINKLEEELGKFLKAEKVVACQSGTSALHLSLIESGIMPGDMVLVPTITFIAAVNPIMYQFAEPIFIDCDDSLCIDPLKMEKFCQEECELRGDKLIHIKTGKHVKAAVIVHVFGNLADMESIIDIAEKYRLIIIEDATEALGSYYTDGRFSGKYAGTIGDFGAYSFNGNKIITTGGGGAVTAKDVRKADHIQYLSTQAKDDSQYYIHDEVGYNYRMTNLQAALGVAQIEELPEFIRRKQENYELYKKLFADYSLGRVVDFRKGTFSNKWFYSLEIDMSKIRGSLRDIITRLQERGVQTRAIWGMIHEQKPYQDKLAYEIDRASYYSSCILNFPSSTQITEEDICFVVKQIREVLGELANE